MAPPLGSQPAVILATLSPPPARPIPVPALAATTLVELVSAPCLLLGWSLAAGAAVARVTFYDGASAGSPLLAVTTLAASGSAVESVAGSGVACSVGLSVAATAATLAGVVWVVTL